MLNRIQTNSYPMKIPCGKKVLRFLFIYFSRQFLLPATQNLDHEYVTTKKKLTECSIH